ncbi:hypothetical protein EDC96DRAFT_526527 [Choanephora cucurbitarum]|nr:hypothetical protein EDC96DRAFT_526527 [Choanephora cucurbitarum]
MSWAELPSEILQQITKILGRDLCQFRLTCNWWYQQAYGFPYHQFKVTGNVFEFTDILSKSPCHPGDIVRSITFTDDFAIADFDGKLKQIVDTIFRACPNVESIHCSPLARNLIWPCIIDSVNKNHCLQRVKYVGESSNMLTKYLKTDEESDLLYVHVMYALRDSITLLKLFNDGYHNLLPAFAALRNRLYCFKSLTALRLHGCFAIEELNTILDSCQTIQVFIIFNDHLKPCIFGPMPSVSITPHMRLRHLQIQNGLAQDRKDIEFMLQKFPSLDSWVLERIDLVHQNDIALDATVQQLIRFGMQIKDFNVRFCHDSFPLSKLRTCLYHLEPSMSVFVSICFTLDREMSHVHINKRNTKVSIYIAWDNSSASLDDLSSLNDLCKHASVQTKIHGKMTNAAKLAFLNSMAQNTVELCQ